MTTKKASGYMLLIWVVLLTSCQQEVDFFITKAKDSLDKNNIDEAVEQVNKGLQYYPENADLHNLMGVIYLNREERSEAMAEFSEAIRLDSSDYRYFYNRGNVYFELEKFNNAAIDYSRASNLNPKEGDIYFNLANAFLQLHNYEDANSNYELCLGLDPTNRQAYIYNARCLLQMKRAEDGLQIMRQANQLQGFSATDCMLIGNLFLEKENIDSACYYFSRSREMGNEIAQLMIAQICTSDAK